MREQRIEIKPAVHLALKDGFENLTFKVKVNLNTR